MPIQKIAGTNVQYSLILFDPSGNERTTDGGAPFSQSIVRNIQQDEPTDIFLFSHGWMGDIPAATSQYDSWLSAMAKLEADRAAMGSGFRPAYIGLHWPSLPWGEETAGGPPASFGTTDAPNLSGLVDEAVAHFGGGDAVRTPLEKIFGAFAADPAARQVPDDALEAYQALGKVIGFSAGGGAGTAPDIEGAPLDPQASVVAQRRASAGQSFGIMNSIKNGILAGLRQMSFWMMKHRARSIGEQGMHQFVAHLMQTSGARIHLMGHSFGCIIMSSVLGGPNAASPLPRKVDSAALVQGAVSLWSYADKTPDGNKPGYFNPIVIGNAVSGPLVTTQSVNDMAVGLAYPAAVALVREVVFGADLPRFGGLGTWGMQGTGMTEARPMLDLTGDYGLQPGRIYNVDGSAFISGHCDITGPQVAHLLWQAAHAGTQSATKGHIA